MIGVVGTGYVGITTALGMAGLGHKVIGYDIDPNKVNSLKDCILPIYENGMQALLETHSSDGSVIFTSNLAEFASSVDFIFLCLPTPTGADGKADLQFLISAVRDLAPILKANAILINKSTVPIGTSAVVKEIINREDVSVVSNPEFLREGSAVHDFNNPSRIVIGGKDAESVKRVAALYEGINCPIVLCSATSAELIKYASNSFLATKISFVNEISRLCDVTGADINEVVYAMGLDSRINKSFLQHGPGWGGSCFPKDTKALLATAFEFGIETPVIRGAIQSNVDHFSYIIDLIKNHLGNSLDQKRIAVWGLAFKAETDDIRDSPAIEIIKLLAGNGAKMIAYDPVVKLRNQDFCQQVDSAFSALVNVDALVVLTEWEEFSMIAPSDIVGHLGNAPVFDTRNILDSDKSSNIRFNLIRIGSK